jgi:hypothetical protein
MADFTILKDAIEALSEGLSILPKKYKGRYGLVILGCWLVSIFLYAILAGFEFVCDHYQNFLFAFILLTSFFASFLLFTDLSSKRGLSNFVLKTFLGLTISGLAIVLQSFVSSFVLTRSDLKDEPIAYISRCDSVCCANRSFQINSLDWRALKRPLVVLSKKVEELIIKTADKVTKNEMLIDSLNREIVRLQGQIIPTLSDCDSVVCCRHYVKYELNLDRGDPVEVEYNLESGENIKIEIKSIDEILDKNFDKAEIYYYLDNITQGVSRIFGPDDTPRFLEVKFTKENNTKKAETAIYINGEKIKVSLIVKEIAALKYEVKVEIKDKIFTVRTELEAQNEVIETRIK